MSIKAIIETEKTIIKRAKLLSNSAYIPLPKELDGQEVSIIPVTMTVDTYLNEMLKHDRFVLNDPTIMKKKVRNLRKYVFGVYVPKIYSQQMMIIVLK